MFLAAASSLLLPGGIYFRGIGTIRGPWVLAFCSFYIVVGIGLLKLSRWARTTTIVIVILDVALQGVALANGLLQVRLMFLAVYLLRIPIWALILWYLLKPEVRLAFAQETTNGEKS
jgi:hypothetical protein